MLRTTLSSAIARIESAPRLKNLRLVLAVVIVLSAVLAALALDQPSCGTYRNDKTITIHSTKIDAEVVQTDAARAKGLSGRQCIEPNRGMLFVFGKPGQYPFWMKDMKFPIDILWLDENQKAVHIEQNLAPSTYPTTYTSAEPALFVLELQAGRAKELNITRGTPINF